MKLFDLKKVSKIFKIFEKPLPPEKISAYATAKRAREGEIELWKNFRKYRFSTVICF